MRILVFSDSHSDINTCIDAAGRIRGVDMILHGGDYLRDALAVRRAYPDIDFHCVAGNCDYGMQWAKEEIIEVCGKNIFLTHGDLYGVKRDYSRLVLRAEECGTDIAVFGHTHVPYSEKVGNIMLLNPGSVRYTRTYGVIEIEDGVLRACTIALPPDVGKTCY